MKKKKSEDRNDDIEQVDRAEETGNNEGHADETVQNEVNEWQVKYDELNEKYLRLYSDFDNYRKRTQKEKLELYKTAGEDIMLAMLPVIDDFDRAEKAMKESRDLDGMKEGIGLIHQKLRSVLENKGLQPMDSAVGKEFDVELHEAITNVKAPSDDMKGKVIDEVEKGYKLNDKVIRFSKVVVGE